MITNNIKESICNALPIPPTVFLGGVFMCMVPAACAARCLFNSYTLSILAEHTIGTLFSVSSLQLTVYLYGCFLVIFVV